MSKTSSIKQRLRTDPDERYPSDVFREGIHSDFHAPGRLGFWENLRLPINER